MTLVDLARKLRPYIEKAAASLQDEDALEAVALFPVWAEGTEYTTDKRVRHGGILYRCLQNHTSQADWTPDVSPSLWARVLIPDPDVIPVWEQPDSTNPYMTGDKVHYPDAEGPVYVSTVDNNVWAPGVYGWEVVE